MPLSRTGGSHRGMHSQASLEPGHPTGGDSVATHRRNGSSQAQLAAAVAINDGPSQRLRSHSAQSEIPDSLGGTNEAKFEARDNKTHLMVEIPRVTRQPQQPKDRITSLQDELKAARAQNSLHIDDVHSQHGEIVHLKHQVRQAYESATEMEGDLRNTIRSLTNTIHERDREVSKLIRDARLDRHNATVSDNTHGNTIHRLQQQVASLTEQLQMTTEEKDRAINNLEDCKERIFKMQPLQAMTDDQISNAYRSLCESIDTWVATGFADVTGGLNTMMAIMCSKDAAYDMTRYIQPVQVELAQQFPLVDNVLLGKLFFAQVYHKLLNPRRMSPGISKSLESDLHALVDGLKRVQPAKGEPANGKKFSSDMK
jgi:hypothetical protein